MSLAVDHFAPTFPDRFNLAEYFLDRRISEGSGEPPAKTRAFIDIAREALRRK